MIRIWLCLAMCVSPVLMAAGPSDRETLRNNEDLKFIRSFEKDQRLKALADALSLSGEQADQLRAMRAEVDRIKEGFSERKQTLTQELETTAKAIRQRLEGGGSFEETDKQQIADIRRRYTRVKKEEWLNIGLAVLNIGDVLTDEQKQVLRHTSLRHDGVGNRSKRGGRGLGKTAGRSAERARHGSGTGKQGLSRGSKRGERARAGRRGGAEGSMARILLSDGFLKNLG